MFSFFAWVVGFVATLLLFKPKQQNAKPPTADDINAPTAKVGENIPVVFGTVLIKNPRVAWWGNFFTVAIKTKGKK